MEYEEFLENLTNTVRMKAGKGIQVSLIQVIKNNQKEVDSLNLLREGDVLAPTLQVGELYQFYENGMSVDQIAENILDNYDRFHDTGSFDLSTYTDYEKMKSNIFCKLINFKKNEFLLTTIPHQKYHDLAIVYFCEIEHELIGKGTILIQNSHLDLWSIDREILHERSVLNTIRKRPYELVSLEELMGEMVNQDMLPPCDPEFEMYVLTNQEKLYGAVNIIFGSVLEAIGERLKRDYYILPSSIHDCMIIPYDPQSEPAFYHCMVREINSEYVIAEEVLGDSVYFYNRKKQELTVVFREEDYEVVVNP